MQAVKGYYTGGHFVPVGLGKLPEGTQAIITLLEEPPKDVQQKLKELDELWDMVQDAADEEMPEIERMNFDVRAGL